MILCTVIQLHYPVLLHCDNTFGFGLISNIAESQRMKYVTALFSYAICSIFPDAPQRQTENTVAHFQDSTSASFSAFAFLLYLLNNTTFRKHFDFYSKS